jgi:hypothetical protein
MNCREYQNQIVLLLYDELPESDGTGLEAHVRQCDDCRHAMEEQKGFHAVMCEDIPTWEVPSDLLVESRRTLADELDRIERKRSWWRVPTFSVVLTPMRLLESATLVALGLAFGVFVSRGVSSVPVEAPPDSAAAVISMIPENGSVANLRIVNTDSTGRVEFVGDVIQPLRFQGQMDDETTQRLLFSAVQDSTNPGSRMQAVTALARTPNEPSVKELLIQRLLNDEEAGVRLKALEGLKPFAGEEPVQAALMEVLKRDPNSGIRSGAIEALTPFISSPAAATQIQQITRDDDSPYIRATGQGVHFVGDQR